MAKNMHKDLYSVAKIHTRVAVSYVHSSPKQLAPRPLLAKTHMTVPLSDARQSEVSTFSQEIIGFTEMCFYIAH